jgi:hypothetical protein
MAQPIWITPAGDLGTIGEGEFFKQTLAAEDPEGGTLSFQLIAGSLPTGVQVKSNGILEGVPLNKIYVQGVPLNVAEDVTSRFAIRATSTNGSGVRRINDRTFEITVTGADSPEFVTPAGRIGTFFDGTQAEIQIQATDADPGDTLTFSLNAGSLPPGLSLNSTTGLISGIILPLTGPPGSAVPGFDASGFDQYQFDFTILIFNQNFQFTLEVTDGVSSSLRDFEIFVYPNPAMVADTTIELADDTFITSDVVPTYPPLITTDTGDLGTYRADNFFIYKFDSINFNNRPVEIFLNEGSLPPGLTLAPSGYLYGDFPDIGAVEITYEFALRVREIVALEPAWNPFLAYSNNSVVSYQGNNYQVLEDVSAGVLPTDTSYWYLLVAPVSTNYDYSITFIGNIATVVTWLTGTLLPGSTTVFGLGSIENGETSVLKVQAETVTNNTLLYRLKPGFNKLPQGLSLLEDGSISGRVSFNGFALDGGTTTFDQQLQTRLSIDPTTFDSTYVFTVNAYTSNGTISVFRTFSVDVVREYNSPYESLYIQAMPPQEDRDYINSLVQNRDIFSPSSLFRPNDPYFGVTDRVRYVHAYGLESATLDEYVASLQLNHFRKRLILGEIKTAQALDSSGNVLYEVVYSDVIDTGVNKLGESPPQSITLPFPATIYSEEATEARELVDENFSNGDLADDNVTALNQVSEAYLEEARDLNLLTNVMSQIARDWMGQGQPGDPAPIWTGDKYIPNPKANDTFTPVPSNQCPVNIGEPLRYDKFKSALEALTADDIIWCDYTVTINKDPNGQKLDPPKVVRSVVPFGFLIEVGDTAYITMRGTQTTYDFTLDFMTGKVINPIAGFGKGKTQNGFTMAYNGLGPDPLEVRAADVPGKSLYSVLNDTTKTKIKIGGHSLGSAISTLIANYAQSLNKFNRVEGYVSASPTVGNQVYADYFNALRDKDGNTLGNNFYRLTNKNDLIPTLPGPLLGFIAVAQEVLFDTLYTNSEGKKDIAKNHSICCCYSYALRHPQNPYNNANEAGVENECVFPVGPTNYYVSFDQHVDNLILYYSSFVEQDGTVSQTITTVYPNSLINMRDQVVDTIGQDASILPLWMTSKQSNGRVLGFTRAWVIAYTNPGESARIAYNIRTQFGETLNRVDWTVDRYILDRELTKNWIPNEDSTDGGNWIAPEQTTFNYDQAVNPTSSGNETTFDDDSIQFVSPVDIYSFTDEYNKYLVFPKINILG